MNILKKTISVFLMILLIAGVFTSCGSSNKKQSDKSLQIVTTVFPAYDWTKEILGDRAEDAKLTMLLDDGVDAVSYTHLSSTFAIDDGADVESVPAEFLPDLIGCSRHLFHRLLKELQSFLAADLSSG